MEIEASRSNKGVKRIEAILNESGTSLRNGKETDLPCLHVCSSTFPHYFSLRMPYGMKKKLSVYCIMRFLMWMLLCS